MDCQHAQDAILAGFDEPQARDLAQGGVLPREIQAHLATCPACTAFLAQQQALDARLSASLLPAPALSAAFREGLRARIRQDVRRDVRSGERRLWLDALPDIVHFASCGAATLLCVVFLPYSATIVAGTGATAALLSYFLLATARSSFEDV